MREFKIICSAVILIFCVACGTTNPTTEIPPATATQTQTITSPTTQSSLSTPSPVPASTPTVVPSPTNLPESTEAPSSAPPTTDVSATVQFDLQGHRGARGLRPENTLPAFEYALDAEVTTLELDLHLTKDGVVVIKHDDDIGKNCHRVGESTSPNPAPMISQLTLDEVKQFQCDLNPDPGRFPDQVAESMPLAGDNYAIPTLAELFQFVSDYSASEQKSDSRRENAAAVRFNIETKRKPNNPAAIGDEFDGETPGLFETLIVQLIEDNSLTGRVTIQSFDHRSINVIPQLNAAIDTVALTFQPADPATVAATTSAKIWSPSSRTLTAQQVTAAHDAGLLVVPWTVNSASEMEQLIEWGVDGLITDYPDLLAIVLREQGISY